MSWPASATAPVPMTRSSFWRFMVDSFFVSSVVAALRARLLPCARLEAGDFHQADFVAGKALDLANEVAVGVAEEGHCDASASCASGAADAVHIVFGHARGVIVHD